MSRILIDGHGGDHAPGVVVEALAQAHREYGDKMTLGIVGQPDVLGPALQAKGLSEAVQIIPASEIIDMCESPANALRRKKDSSMHVGARMVRDGEWEALVSAGNTGALMAISKMILKTLPGVDRPAIASMIPAEGGRTLLLDAGANVDSSSEHLTQFAIMGSCYMQAAEGIASPRVGVLNIGSEDIKGTDVVKMAVSSISKLDLNFIGNVEGTDLFGGKVDVVVCDGFVGNVALKTMEGVAHFLMGNIKQELTSSPLAKLGALLSMGGLRRLKKRINPSEYNGAPLLGLNGMVVKSHGSADALGFFRAVEMAHREVESQLGSRIVESMNQWMED